MAIALLSTVVAHLLYCKILVWARSANLMLVSLLIPPIAVDFVVTDGRLLDRLLKKEK